MAGISLKPKENIEVDEKRKVEDWLRFIFRDEMQKAGMTEIMADDIEVLIHSEHATWEKIKTLRENNCPPDLIIKILS